MAGQFDDLIQQAYAGIGRSGVGEGVNQIDPKGLEYWQGQLQSGALAPQNFQQAFTGAVQGALANPTLAATPQYQYVQDYLQGQTGSAGALPTAPPVAPLVDAYSAPIAPPTAFDGMGTGQAPVISTGGGKARLPQDVADVYGGVYERPGEMAPPPMESTAPLNQLTDLMSMRGGGFDNLTPQVNATQVAPTTYGYINDLYKSVLGRDADEEGLRYWSGKFGESMSPDERAEWMAIAKPGSNVSANSITALGDSTTWGYNMGQQVGANMTNTAQSILSQDLGQNISINNMGVNGSSLGDAINRGDIEKALGDNSSTVLLNYGMNEAYRGEDPNAFRQQLMDTVQQLKAAGKDVVLQTPNYTEGIKGVGTYADVIRDVAAKTGASLHDKWDETQSLYGQYDPNDPVHPTQQVYQYLGNSLANLLKSKYKG